MIKLIDIIEKIKPLEVIGSIEKDITNVISIENYSNMESNSICWINQKNDTYIKKIKKGIIICPKINSDKFNPDCTYVIVEDPRKVFALVMNLLSYENEVIEIHSSCIIDKSVIIGNNVSIGAYTIIEKDCVIEDNIKIGCNNVIKKGTIIESNVKIGNNNTIGDIGFGYVKNDDGEYERIPHIGNVIIKKNVEISNNVCIDRAVLGSTIIGINTKIDNLVHIAHGVKIGKNSMVIANSMIAGSTIVGENVWIAPSSSILNKINIEDNSIIGMGAVVLKNVNKKEVVAGNPARTIKIL